MERGAVAAAAGSSTVAFSWEHEPGVSKKQISPPVEAKKTGPAAGAKKAAGEKPPRLHVPPPPGGPGTPAVSPLSARSRSVRPRPEEDPFLAAYLACTANGRRKEGGGTGRKAAQKLLGWAGLGLGLGLGLSCKSSCGVVEGRAVRLAKIPEVADDGDYYKC